MNRRSVGLKLAREPGSGISFWRKRYSMNAMFFHRLCLVWLAVVVVPGSALAARTLGLHPANPHYFLFRGKPTVLITSGEHYGAVLNRDFDYLTYLDTLKAEGM